MNRRRGMLSLKKERRKFMKDLIKKIPNKHREGLLMIEREDGLIDGLKYMVYLKEGFTFTGGDTSLPVSGIKEAIHFIKDVEKVESLKIDRLIYEVFQGDSYVSLMELSQSDVKTLQYAGYTLKVINYEVE